MNKDSKSKMTEYQEEKIVSMAKAMTEDELEVLVTAIPTGYLYNELGSRLAQNEELKEGLVDLIREVKNV